MNSASLRRSLRALSGALLAALLAGSAAAAPDVAFAPHLPRRIEVDGSLEEWDTSRPVEIRSGAHDPRPDGPAGWKDASDCAASLFACWDDGRLYFAGRVDDDRLVVQPGQLYLGDCIEVFLRIPGEAGPEDYQLVLCPMAQETRWVFPYFRGRRGLTDGGFDGVEVAGREVRDDKGNYRGYEFEAAVPLANFPGFEPAGAVAGLNLAVVDADSGPGQESYLLWSGKTLPAYDPSALAELRFEGSRTAAAAPDEGTGAPGLAAWKVPAAILGGGLLVLALLYALRKPLRRIGDLPLRRRAGLALAAAALLVGVRLVPGIVEQRRRDRAAARLAKAEEALLGLADEAARARVLAPGRTAETASPLLRLVEGRRVPTRPEYEFRPLPAAAGAPRRTLGGGVPVRAAEIPLAGAGRVAFRLPEPLWTESLCVVLSWRDPVGGRTGPPPGTVVGRIGAVGADGITDTLDVRLGREVDDERSARADAHDATESRVAWTFFTGGIGPGPPVGHADEVLWRLPDRSKSLSAGPWRIHSVEVEQVVAEGVLTLRGVTALPPQGGEPLPLPLGRTTQEGVPTSSWNGGPAGEVLALGPGAAKGRIPLDAEADVLFVVYGSPGGPTPESAGKPFASLRPVLEDGPAPAPVILEGGVHVDAEALAGLGHPADFQGTLAYRWAGPGGSELHRDSVALPVAAPPGSKVKALEVELLAPDGRLVVDSVVAARRLQRPPPTGLTRIERREDGWEPSPGAGAALEGIAVTHYRSGRAVATTLPADLRERVLGTEAPPGIRSGGAGELPAGVYLRSVGGRTFLARQARLPLREGDEMVEAAVPAPDAADLEAPVLAAVVLLLVVLLPLALTAVIDLLGLLPRLRWKLAGAFAVAAVLPLVALTLLLARHFEAAVDRGMEQELRAHADAAARALAARRDEARRLADEMLRDESLHAALESPDEPARAARIDAVVRDLARRQGGGAGGAARVSLEVRGSGEGGAERRTFPLRETPAPFQGLYEPTDGLDYRWSRLVAAGVARARVPSGRLRLVVELPVDDRALGEVRRAGGERAHVLLYSPDGYPVAGTADLAEDRSADAVAARRAVADDLRRAPGEPEIRERSLGGLSHAVAFDLVRSGDGRTVGLLATALPRPPLLAAALGTRDLVLLLGFSVFLVAVVVADLVMRRVADPVAELARAARRIEQGDLRVRAEEEGRDEIASLAVAFNRMTGQLEGRIGELSRLNGTQAEFASVLDRGRVLERTLAAFRESAAPAAALVLLADRGRGDVEVAAGFRGADPVEPARIPASGFLGAALRDPAARVVPVPPGADGPEAALLAGAGEAVVLPFAAGRGRIEGAVLLLRAPGGGASAAASSLDFLAALARQAGNALENARLYRLAVEDPSTGLYAASYFKRRLQEEIDRSVEAGRPASLLLLGIEGVGAVFESRGPEEGNALVLAVAERVRAEVRRMHILGRAGRDVLALLLPETPRAAAEETAAALRAAVEGAPFDAGGAGREVRLGLTCAVAAAPDDAGSAEFLENEAVHALERARAGRRGAPAAGAPAGGPPGVDPAEAEALGFRSAKSLLLLDALNRIAAGDVPVLVLGETGAGKEVVADVLHAKSRRSAGPLVKVNCAALPGPLLEAELFGHERGAFTGADRRRAGRFEQAHGGTLFLDEIGELPPELQVKLLRVLQDRRVERLGGEGPVEVDVRVVAATNRDLPAMIEAGTFREDLYYRLNVLSVVVPPLRARREDIPPLAARFLAEAAAKHGRGPTGFSPEALDALFRHPFPGNVRQLRNMVERAVVSARGPLVAPADLSFGEERRTAAGTVPESPRGLSPQVDGTLAGSRHVDTGDSPAPLSPRAERLLESIRGRGSLTNRQWCEESGVSARTGLRDFEELMAAGLVLRSGKRRSAAYRAATRTAAPPAARARPAG